MLWKEDEERRKKQREEGDDVEEVHGVEEGDTRNGRGLIIPNLNRMMPFQYSECTLKYAIECKI